MRALVTGGCGFIGSELVRRLLELDPAWDVVNLDLLTYAGSLDNVEGLERPRHRFHRADVADAKAVMAVFDAEPRIDVVFHLAAESHVDRSITAGMPFVRTNVLGTQVMLECARAAGVSRFVHMSTDEVYGDLTAGTFATESTPLAPSSPYSASKAGADLLVLAFHRTYPELEVVLARPSNTYGPRQFPEKLIPLILCRALAGEPLPIYGDGTQVRDWIHVRDTCDALLCIAEGGRPGSIYNVSAGQPMPNLDLVKHLLALTGAPSDLIQHVTDRPGHDRRYALDATKLREELGWAPRIRLDDGLRQTVAWYRNNAAWCDARRKSATGGAP